MLDRTKVEALRAMFIDVVQDIRKAKSDADMPSFHVELEASGRTFNGEAALKFTIGDYSYTSAESVTAPELIPAFEEHMRRKGFTARHQALALPNPGSSFEPDRATDDEEIPY